MTAVHGPPWTLAADKRAQKERALSADAEKGRGTHGAGAGWRGGESGDWYWHMCTAICKTQLVGPCWIQGAQLSTVLTYTGGVGVAGRLERDRACVYLCLIHADVWQKPIQYFKAVILQLRIKKKTTPGNNTVMRERRQEQVGQRVFRAAGE